MARALTLGNGKILVGLDKYGFVRDFYFPYVGLENHVSGHQHRIGVWIEGEFSWIDDGSWDITIGYKNETMVGYLVCKREDLGVSIVMEDIVYNEHNIFVRQVDVYNMRDEPIEVRLFFHQVFLIHESKKRNTAFYDPTHATLVHYKGRRVFVANGKTDAGTGIDAYCVGEYQYGGKEGTFRDAEDGELGSNAVEHGSVDSVMRLSLTVQPREKARAYYWICAAKSLETAYQLNDLVLQKTPGSMVHSTSSYWRAWLDTHVSNLADLPPEHKKLFDTSLFIVRSHLDNRGSIIAASDSEMIEYGKDDYSYMWPRDAAFIVSVLCKAGFEEVVKPFFSFCTDVLHPDGYLHHRYRSDKSLGSTWHSTAQQTEWLKNKLLQLPIQEDETASVLVALWEYYTASKDVEFIEALYKPLIEKMATFLVQFRDKKTGLPLPSYDLWEEVMGVSTYTCASVYGGLMAAARFSELLDKRNHMREYTSVAKEIKKAACDYLYDPDLASFVRYGKINQSGEFERVRVVDASSLFGLWHFGMLDHTDERFKNTRQQVQARLWNPSQLGGYIRYERDAYFRASDLPNPWFITTLWDAQCTLLQPELTERDLESAKQTLDWVVEHVYQSGILAEQLDPYTGESLSATPLVWSHAVYIETIQMYLEKKRDLELGTEVLSQELHVI
ncbi:MAG: glycoside hydrolase family 15 protein [Pseudomonadales bacterium]|nr:glycoside hydrolase family 15 protein [Candidatus Woesebacteria bacterium]MCB9802089.1 glycoside hydrolase family 15 protein [Pseudomonadales bacterium]